MEFIELQEIYKNELNKRQKICFMGKQKKEDDEKKVDITNMYFDILKKYNLYNESLAENIPKKKHNFQKICKTCKSKNIIETEHNIEICLKCGTEDEKLQKSMNYKDISRVNISHKYYYERRIHFYDTICQFQGKQNATIDEKVYKDLEEQFERHGLLFNSTNKKEKYKNITREHIYIFLKETGHSKNYEDDLLIFSKITGKKNHDISHLEAKLMEDFNEIIKEYDKRYKNNNGNSTINNRKSFINSQIILYQLLKRHKYPCDKSDFNILKTIDRLAFHDTIIEEIFNTIGFNFSPLF
jgi:ribosomal protein L37AE/L43A